MHLGACEHYKSTITTFAKTIQDILRSHGDDPLGPRECRGHSVPRFVDSSHASPSGPESSRWVPSPTPAAGDHRLQNDQWQTTQPFPVPTPPVGTYLFLGCGVSGISITDVTLTLIPFFLAMSVALILITYLLPCLCGFRGSYELRDLGATGFPIYRYDGLTYFLILEQDASRLRCRPSTPTMGESRENSFAKATILQ